ncbi:hypothetical protein ThimaDRAFT_1595 [Thiocapsa marina 5811]|uniref:Uncharacterized protein n=1 Tax=Thiocapsa marina 5811 TaxID=768671 RepID=F9U9J3_9GAMM|nr:hypothetical protein ThimaDRAFT_1595 [Thiocapsa marina 5811]
MRYLLVNRYWWTALRLSTLQLRFTQRDGLDVYL